MSLSAEAIVAALPALRRYARRWCERAADAEDLVQETAARAWLYRTYYIDAGAATEWLMTLMHNLAATEYRRRRRRPEVLFADPPEHAACDDPEISVWYGDVVRAIEALPQQQREALVESVLGSPRAAAARERIPVSTMGSRIHRARQALRRLAAPDSGE